MCLEAVFDCALRDFASRYEVPIVAADILAPHAAFRTPQECRFAGAAHWAGLPVQTCLCAASQYWHAVVLVAALSDNRRRLSVTRIVLSVLGFIDAERDRGRGGSGSGSGSVRLTAIGMTVLVVLYNSGLT